MKLLFVSEYFPPYIKGGAEVSTSIIAKELSHNNIVTVLTQKHLSSNLWNLDSIVVVPCLYETSNDFSKSYTIFYHLTTGMLLNPFINLFIVVNEIKKRDIEILNIVATSYLLIPIVIAGILLKRAVVVDLRSGSLICPVEFSRQYCFEKNVKKHNCFKSLSTPTGNWSNHFEIFRLFFAIYKYVIFFTNKSLLLILSRYKRIKFIALSQYIKEQYIYAGISGDKIEVVYNPVNNKSFKAKNDNSNELLYVGRLEKEKGIWDLLKAFSQLNAKNIILNIAGNGSEFNSINKYIIKNNLKNINLLGRLNFESLKRYLINARLLVAPSIWPEPFGRFIQESYSLNTPLITTNVGGIPEEIEHLKTGFLVNPNSPKEIAFAIDTLLSDINLYRKIVKNLKGRENIFDVKYLVNKRLSIYNELLNKSS